MLELTAISIREPHASLIASGVLKLHVRSWDTKFRGDLLIHSSNGVDIEEMKRLSKLGWFRDWLVKTYPQGAEILRTGKFSRLERQGIIGGASLAEVVEASQISDWMCQGRFCSRDLDAVLKSKRFGNLLVFENQWKTKKILPFKGRKGLFAPNK